MADHGGLYNTTKLRQIEAKGGKGGMRARCLSYCKGGEEEGDCGRTPFPLVALDSLVRGGRGHSGAVRCLSFLGEEEMQGKSSLP
jgi:hypothetical protein